MRISDWSSDVCSSDLDRLDVAVGPGAEPGVGISGRQGDRVQPVDLGAIRDARAVRIPIGPPVAPLRAGDAGGAVIGIDDPRQGVPLVAVASRSEEHTSELQSLMRSSYAVFCLKKKRDKYDKHNYY